MRNTYTINEDITTIELTNGMFCTITTSDLNKVVGITGSWKAKKINKVWYVVYHDNYQDITMHRVVLGLTKGDGTIVDHKDGNGLNNTRDNIKIVTHRENMINRRFQDNNTSGYRSVYKNKTKWRVLIKSDGKHISKGNFDSKLEAARVATRCRLELGLVVDRVPIKLRYQ